MIAENRSENPNTAHGRALAAAESPIYEIKVQGHLGEQWAGWFDGLTIDQEHDGVTVLTGPMADQAALHGLLVRIRNLCLPLISVSRLARPSRGNQMPTAE